MKGKKTCSIREKAPGKYQINGIPLLEHTTEALSTNPRLTAESSFGRLLGGVFDIIAAV
jgi:hypothetical protein